MCQALCCVPGHLLSQDFLSMRWMDTEPMITKSHLTTLWPVLQRVRPGEYETILLHMSSPPAEPTQQDQAAPQARRTQPCLSSSSTEKKQNKHQQGAGSRGVQAIPTSCLTLFIHFAPSPHDNAGQQFAFLDSLCHLEVPPMATRTGAAQLFGQI